MAKQKKETLWSMSTTIREAERIVGFLNTAALLEGKEWDKPCQCHFQTLLIQTHQYLNDIENTQVRNKLNKQQIQALGAWDKEMSYAMAKSIFDSKQYQDPPMRGRQSMSPLVKLGLVYYENKIIHISDMGHKLLNQEITFEDMMLDALLKYQYPNPTDSGFQKWNTKPFINALRLIKRVDDLCTQRKQKAKGISTQEFGIFALSLKHYSDVDIVAKRLLDFRANREQFDKEADKEHFTKQYINSYLADFNNPIKNCKEYTDNMVRYFRMTKYVYIRGKYDHTYIDLEPRRMTEINAILDNDNGIAKNYSLTQWNQYMGVYGTYILPFETLEKLTTIATEIKNDITQLENNLHIPVTARPVPNSVDKLKTYIKEQRAYRTHLQNLEIKQSVHQDYSKINETIESLTDIYTHNSAKLSKKFSIELEKWTNIALNILNDAVLIKPNSPVGDDNEPIYTAPNGVPDIECYYKTFNAICEVTMLTSRDQWFNEGQPVMRHLRDFEKNNSTLPNYCLFVAPSIHKDTVNTFYTSVKYEYEGQKQHIIPITIPQLECILQVVQSTLQKNKPFKHNYIKSLYDCCTDLSDVKDSTQWLDKINNSISTWSKQILH